MSIKITAEVEMADGQIETFELEASSVKTAEEQLDGLQNYLDKKEAEALSVIEE